MTHAGLKGRCFLELKSVLLEVGYIEKWLKFAYLELKVPHLKFRVMRDRVYMYVNRDLGYGISSPHYPTYVSRRGSFCKRQRKQSDKVHFVYKSNRMDSLYGSFNKCFEWPDTRHSPCHILIPCPGRQSGIVEYKVGLILGRHLIRVPTAPGKPGKMVTVFPAWKNPGILSFLPNILEK